jgi:hypothetical protein
VLIYLIARGHKMAEHAQEAAVAQTRRPGVHPAGCRHHAEHGRRAAASRRPQGAGRDSATPSSRPRRRLSTPDESGRSPRAPPPSCGRCSLVGQRSGGTAGVRRPDFFAPAAGADARGRPGACGQLARRTSRRSGEHPVGRSFAEWLVVGGEALPDRSISVVPRVQYSTGADATRPQPCGYRSGLSPRRPQPCAPSKATPHAAECGPGLEGEVGEAVVQTIESVRRRERARRRTTWRRRSRCSAHAPVARRHHRGGRGARQRAGLRCRARSHLRGDPVAARPG